MVYAVHVKHHTVYNATSDMKNVAHYLVSLLHVHDTDVEHNHLGAGLGLVAVDQAPHQVGGGVTWLCWKEL